MRRLTTVLVVTVLTVASAVVALEVGLRVMGIGSDALMQPHPWCGWVHTPGRRGSVESEDRSLGRQMAIAIDSLGLRDVERRREKPPGTYRVALIGDSFVEAQQVPLDSSLSRRLERRLAGTAGRNVEVWNCGVSGYSTCQEWMYLRHVASAFHPDLVVLAFLAGNDVADAVPEHATSLRNRPFFHFAGSGDSLVMDRSQFRPDPPGVRWLRAHSRAFAWASTLRQRLRMGAQQRAAATDTSHDVPDDLQIYAVTPDSSWALAWRLCERQILETRDDARRIGAGFLLVTISGGAQESPNGRAGSSAWRSWEGRPEIAIDEPEQRLVRLAEANGIDHVELLEAFRAAQAKDGVPRHIGWVAHWNSAGHALAADVLAPRIAAIIAKADSVR